MMTVTGELNYDVASALAQGEREQQEDAVIADFPLDADIGLAVLADGMGGHAAGDIASKIVVTEVFSELKLRSGNTASFEDNIPEILHDAAAGANDCVRHYTDAHPESKGMGATLVASALVRDKLYWISIGDSPLFLFRDGKLSQLNEDHSLAGQIDLLVEKGLMAQEAGENHPDRHCLTSVLIGAQIPRIDCPKTPLTLRPDDIVLVASDGLQFLDNSEIADLIAEYAHLSSAEITRNLIAALEALGDPHQDNTSLCVIKAHAPGDPIAEPAPTASADLLMAEALRALKETAKEVGEPAPIAADQAGLPAKPNAVTQKSITLMTRKSMDGMSMFYQLKRQSEKSA